jgi:hypothetical protein
MKRPIYYSQFDGENIGGTRYGLGDAIDEDTNPEILTILAEQGRISANKPTSITAPLVGSDKSVEDMSRAELEGSALSIMSTKILAADDDKLRQTIELHREDEANKNRDDSDDGKEPETPGKPLEKMTTAELVETATNESVDFGEDVKTNADRVKAIQAARDVKAKAGDAPQA